MAQTLSPFFDSIVIMAAGTTAPFPPTAWAFMRALEQTCPPEVELVLSCGATSDTLSASKLYSGILQPFTIAGQTATFNHTTGVVSKTTHGLATGDGPVQLTNSGGAIPAGLALLTNYWVVVIDANTFYLASSFAGAMAATPVTVSFTGNGSGTNTYTGVSSQRVMWCETLDIAGKQIGRAGDGAVALTTQTGWRQRFSHSPETVAYAVSATLSAGTLSASVTPVSSR